MAGEPDTSWLPEMLRPLAAAFIKATDILPTGKEHGYWIQSLTEQWEAGIKPDTLTKTVKKMRHDGLTIKNPGSCLAVARDLHGKRNSSDEVWAEVHK